MTTQPETIGNRKDMPAPVKAFMARAADLVERRLKEILPSEDAGPSRLNAAVRYSTLAGGKRLRPALVLAAAEAVGGGWEDVAELACALEMIHTYSLIHDDLPAMDDDMLRRGMPTCHVKFGEATAILAGDALLTLAFETIAQLPRRERVPDVVACVAKAAGWAGMVGGQQLDLDAEGRRQVTAEDVLAIHARKTAALMAASLEGGAIACGAPEAQSQALRRYGQQIGLAFQIADDVLDETTPPDVLGKTPGKDREQGKATYVKVAGIEGSLAAARERCRGAKAELAVFAGRAEVLGLLADYIVERVN